MVDRCSGEITRFKSLIKRDALFTRAEKGASATVRKIVSEDITILIYETMNGRHRSAVIGITGLLFERLSIDQTSPI